MVSPYDASIPPRLQQIMLQQNSGMPSYGGPSGFGLFGGAELPPSALPPRPRSKTATGSDLSSPGGLFGGGPRGYTSPGAMKTYDDQANWWQSRPILTWDAGGKNKGAAGVGNVINGFMSTYTPTQARRRAEENERLYGKDLERAAGSPDFGAALLQSQHGELRRKGVDARIAADQARVAREADYDKSRRLKEMEYDYKRREMQDKLSVIDRFARTQPGYQPPPGGGGPAGPPSGMPPQMQPPPGTTLDYGPGGPPQQAAPPAPPQQAPRAQWSDPTGTFAAVGRPQESFIERLLAPSGAPPPVDPMLKGYLYMAVGEEKAAIDALVKQGADITEAQTRKAGFAAQMMQTEVALQELGGFSPATYRPWLGKLYQDYGPNFTQSTEFQRYYRNARQWVIAKLRDESGATITEPEIENDFKTFFPQHGDDEATVRDKEAQRVAVARGKRIAAGEAFDRHNPGFDRWARSTVDMYHRQNAAKAQRGQAPAPAGGSPPGQNASPPAAAPARPQAVDDKGNVLTFDGKDWVDQNGNPVR